MSLASPTSAVIDGAGYRIGIAAARFNPTFVDGLLAHVVDALSAAGVKSGNVTTVRVPGSHEVPWAAQALAKAGACDCVIGLGVLIAGDTSHHELVGQSVSY